MSKPFNIVLKSHIKPGGGPSGYLYNLCESIRESNIDSIRILSPDVPVQSNSVTKRKSRIKLLIRYLKLKYTPSSLRYSYLKKKEKRSYADFYPSIEKELKDASLNSFHGTTDFYYYKKNMPDNLTLTTLMCHSPVITHLELLEGLQDNNYSKATTDKLFENQKMMDVFAFKNADYIVFPCEQAVSPYDDFIEEHSIDRNKFRYIVTASKPMTFKISRDEFRSMHGISKDTIALAYIGRKNKIKGYDVFCQTALNLKKSDKFVFLSAGGGVIKTPQSSNIIDFGWTSDPGSILNACDYVVAPNKETYFDLGIIQALSLNKPIITTPTGGNRWFMNKEVNMTFINHDVNELTECIANLDKSEDDLNVDFFRKYLDNSSFAKNYLSFFESISNENIRKCTTSLT